MPQIFDRAAGDLWNPSDWTTTLKAILLNIVLNSTNNELKELLSWGDPTAAEAHHLLSVLFTSGQVRAFGWDKDLHAWVIETAQGVRKKIATTDMVTSGLAAALLFFSPPYTGVSRLTTTFTTTPPKFEPGWDATAVRTTLPLDNADSALATGETFIEFLVPSDTTLQSFKVWHKRTGSDANTFLTLQLIGTDGNAVTLTGGATLQSGTWTEATVTIGAGVLAANGKATIKLTHSAAAGERQDSGAIRIVTV